MHVVTKLGSNTTLTYSTAYIVKTFLDIRLKLGLADKKYLIQYRSLQCPSLKLEPLVLNMYYIQYITSIENRIKQKCESAKDTYPSVFIDYTLRKHGML
jgi:hypothetical protein